VFLWFFAQEREEAAADMEMATRSIEEKVELESMLAELKATVASQQKETVDRELHISSLDQQLKVTNRTLDDLQLELSRSTSAVQVSDRFFRTVTKILLLRRILSTRVNCENHSGNHCQAGRAL